MSPILVAFWQQTVLQTWLMTIFHLKIFSSSSIQLCPPSQLALNAYNYIGIKNIRWDLVCGEGEDLHFFLSNNGHQLLTEYGSKHFTGISPGAIPHFRCLSLLCPMPLVASSQDPATCEGSVLTPIRSFWLHGTKPLLYPSFSYSPMSSCLLQADSFFSTPSVH